MLPEPTLTSVGVDQDSFLGFHLVCISTRMVPPSGPALDARLTLGRRQRPRSDSMLVTARVADLAPSVARLP